ncbi:MAG: NAD-binding protein [Agathobacter sp.]
MAERLEKRCKSLMEKREYDKCEKAIQKAMAADPHSAVPHNLMGILMEKKGDHVLAMKHFRAADGTGRTGNRKSNESGEGCLAAESLRNRKVCEEAHHMWNKNQDCGRILIVGGQEEARSLANSLMKKDYRVTVVNRDYEACEKLAENGRLHVIFGDGSKKFILEEAQAGSCRVVIALTGSDEKNLVICEMCKEYFGVKKAVALLNDPAKTNFFYQMGVDRVVCALNMISNLMEEQALMDDMMKLVPIDEGRIHIAEVPIPHGAPITEKKLWELNLPKEIIIGCILRGDQSLIPRGDTRVMEGDVLVMITSDQSKLEEIKELTEYAKV